MKLSEILWKDGLKMGEEGKPLPLAASMHQYTV